MKLIIKRGVSTFAEVEIDEKTIYSKKLMGEHKVRTEFYSSAPLPLQLGDHITVGGTNYSLNRLPEIQKINNQTYKYFAEFEGPEYGLYNKLFMYDGLTEFDYTGTPADFVALIVGQANQTSSGWSSGSVDIADEKTLSFANLTCRQALNHVAEAFKMEYILLIMELRFKLKQ